MSPNDDLKAVKFAQFMLDLLECHGARTYRVIEMAQRLYERHQQGHAPDLAAQACDGKYGLSMDEITDSNTLAVLIAEGTRFNYSSWAEVTAPGSAALS